MTEQGMDSEISEFLALKNLPNPVSVAMIKTPNNLYKDCYSSLLYHLYQTHSSYIDENGSTINVKQQSSSAISETTSILNVLSSIISNYSIDSNSISNEVYLQWLLRPVCCSIKQNQILSNNLLTHSRYQGIPYLPLTESYPVCSQCKRKYEFLFQLRMNELPPLLQQHCALSDEKIDEQLFQCFYCLNCVQTKDKDSTVLSRIIMICDAGQTNLDLAKIINKAPKLFQYPMLLKGFSIDPELQYTTVNDSQYKRIVTISGSKPNTDFKMSRDFDTMMANREKEKHTLTAVRSKIDEENQIEWGSLYLLDGVAGFLMCRSIDQYPKCDECGNNCYLFYKMESIFNLIDYSNLTMGLEAFYLDSKYAAGLHIFQCKKNPKHFTSRMLTNETF